MSESDIAIKVENLSKQYRIGQIGTGTLSHDLNRWWAALRGKEDPYLKIGETNDRASKGNSQYVWSLKDINFEVKQGEVLGIIGKNGAGKSTLLKVLSKVTGPTTGKVLAKGRIGALLEVGTGFHPELTGRENVFLNGAILGMTKSEIKDKIDEIIDFSGCTRYIDTPVKRYSSGMKVRLAFAVAAFLEPEILIVDEVLAVGDAEFQKKAIGKMQDVSKSGGRTVLFVSHNMAAVKSICSRVIVLNQGGIEFDGKTLEGIQNYLSSSIEKSTSFRKVNIELGETNFIIEDIYVKGNENIIGQIYTGDNVKIVVPYSCNTKVSSILISVHILDEYGKKIVTFNPMHYGDKLVSLSSTGELICEVDNFPLKPGSYQLSFWIMLNDTKEVYGNEVLSFEVEGGDYYGNGILTRKENDLVFYHKNEWTVNHLNI